MTIKNELLKGNDFLRTGDLSMAAVIFLFKPLEGVDRQDPKRAQFIFKRSQELNDLVTKFQRKELKVEPLAYFAALREIKARLYER
jgi:hypothetical protein